MKHINVSVFVPHAGCPHQCSFCNQRSISGAKSQPTAQDVRDAALVAMRSSPEGIKDGEIAFFGGSFTAIFGAGVHRRKRLQGHQNIHPPGRC